MGLIRNGDTRPTVVVYIAFMHVTSLEPRVQAHVSV